MNVLHLHTGLNLTCGISKTIYLIAKYPGENYTHYVLALNGDAGEKFRDAGIKTEILNSDKNIFGNLPALKKYVKGNNIKIIHSHHRYADYLAYLVSFFCKVKRVTSVQSFVYGKKSFSYKSPVLLAAGESVKKHLTNYFSIKEERIKVFNNFVDLSESKNAKPRAGMRAELGIREDEYVTGYIGRFSEEEKGTDILISAFKKFSEKHSESKLIMVGSGEDIDRNTVSKNVIVIDAQKNIFDYYSIFDCIVLPSRIDPFPVTVLESGMTKIPFIGSDVNGIPEIVTDKIEGLLFEKGNADMLLEKMERFYAERNYTKDCAENLYKKVCEKYTHEAALKKLNEIYGSL